MHESFTRALSYKKPDCAISIPSILIDELILMQRTDVVNIVSEELKCTLIEGLVIRERVVEERSNAVTE